VDDSGKQRRFLKRKILRRLREIETGRFLYAPENHRAQAA
jgi:hypothetical protein